MDTTDVHLILFLSRATTLGRWNEMGILERETAIYKRMRPSLASFSIVTSGGRTELDYQARLGDTRILYNRWRLPPNIYSLLAPFIHRRALRQATVYKTNQLDGAWTAVVAARVHRRPVVVRAGYLWAKNLEAEHGKSFKSSLVRFLERFSLRSANRVIVTTEAMRRFVVDSYGMLAERIAVVPNYVDTELFRKLPDVSKVKGRICFVGRLNAVKNLPLLIEAVAGLPGASLVFVGEGEQEPHLRKLAEKHGVRVEFLGALDHERLPAEINRSEVFVLPSKFEGHPKALIEAMACEAAVVGSNVDGIRDVISDGDNGLLCPPTVAGLKSALEQLLANSDLRLKLGASAREFSMNANSLDRVADMEFEIYRTLLEAR